MNQIIRLADTIEHSSVLVKEQVERNVGKVTDVLKPGSEYAKSFIKPLDQPLAVNEQIKSAASGLEEFSRYAAQVSKQLVHLGTWMYKMFTVQAQLPSASLLAILPREFKYLWEKLLIALGNLLMAVKLLLKTLSMYFTEAVIDVIGHRYGAELKQLLQHVSSSIGHFFAVFENSQSAWAEQKLPTEPSKSPPHHPKADTSKVQ